MRPVLVVGHLFYALVFLQVLLGDYAIRFDATILGRLHLPFGISVFGVALLLFVVLWRTFPRQPRLRVSALLALLLVIAQGILGFVAFSDAVAGFVHLALAFVVFGLGMAIAVRVRALLVAPASTG